MKRVASLDTRAFVTTVTLLVSIVSGVCVELSDPGEKKVTFQTEVERGIAAVDAIPKMLDASAFDSAYWKMFGRNQQQDTDSDGFSLGAGVRMAMRLDEIANSPSASPDSRSFARTSAQLVWNTARMQALGSLKLDDDQIDKLFGLEVLKRLKTKP